MRLCGRTAFITGAGRNIGKQIALTFAREGADLLLNARSDKKALVSISEECRKLGVKTHVGIGDVSDSQRVAEIVQEGIDSLGKIDILVSNAAVRPHKPILEISNDEWHRVFGINLHATFYIIKAILPGMMERRYGSIIAIGGKAAISAAPGTAVVSASKTGLLGLVRAVAAEMAPYNIRANMINPGTGDTERNNPEWYPENQSVSRRSPQYLKKIPMGRLFKVDDIANACLFMASDESSYITGERLNVMGGFYIV